MNIKYVPISFPKSVFRNVYFKALRDRRERKKERGGRERKEEGTGGRKSRRDREREGG